MRRLSAELVREWRQRGEELRWVPPRPANVLDFKSRYGDARAQRLTQSALVAGTIAALATGGMLKSGHAAPGNPAQAAGGSTTPATEVTRQIQAIGGGQKVSYTVQPGDTLHDIAARYGVSTMAVINANALPNPDLIYPGDVITIPTGGGQASAPAGITVEVQPGDTVWILSQRYGVDPYAIINHGPNGLTNPNLIYPGQKLFIPGAKGPAKAQAQAQSQSAPAPKPNPPAAGGGSQTAPAPPPAPKSTPAPKPAATGFVWPARGTITQRYGPTGFWMEPAYQGYAHFHQGLDIANGLGTPIVAAGSGTVIFAGWSNSGYGFCVQIDHGNGLVTLYGHMASQPVVQVGQHVNQGQLIGKMGSTGASTGSHLHFAVMKNGAWVNPLNFLK